MNKSSSYTYTFTHLQWMSFAYNYSSLQLHGGPRPTSLKGHLSCRGLIAGDLRMVAERYIDPVRSSDHPSDGQISGRALLRIRVLEVLWVFSAFVRGFACLMSSPGPGQCLEVGKLNSPKECEEDRTVDKIPASLRIFSSKLCICWEHGVLCSKVIT